MSWQERIRQAEQVGRERAEKEALERKILSEQQARAREEAERQKRAERERVEEQLKKELTPILERFGVRRLLEGIRRDVWKVGKVDLCVGSNGAGYSLNYNFRVIESYIKGYSGSGYWGGESYRVGPKQAFRFRNYDTSLDVWIRRYTDKNGYYLTVRDSEVALRPIQGADRFGEFSETDCSDPQTQEKLEELLLRSCLERKANDGFHSPRHLRAMKIQQKEGWDTPWYMKLFR